MTPQDLVDLLEDGSVTDPWAVTECSPDVSSLAEQMSKLGGLGNVNVAKNVEKSNKEVITYNICPACKKKERRPAAEDGFFTETDTEAGSDC